MKIVHILTRLLRAGSEENTLLTAAGQIARGHDVILLHGHDVNRENATRLAPGAELVEAPSLTREVNPPCDYAAFNEIRDILVGTRPDVVHTHQSKAGVLGRFAAAKAREPLIVHGVHILPFLGVGRIARSAYLWSERRAAHVTDGFIHVSNGMRLACLANGVGTGLPHYVVPSGFDLERFSGAEPPPDRAEILGRHTGTERPFVIVMLAALEARKRQLDLLARIGDFLKQFPQVHLVFAGEGQQRQDVESEIATLGLGDQITVLGFRDDPERIIAMADACIHCAEREGLPRSILQYLVAGRPVVLFELPGIEEVVTDGVNGCVVPQGNWPLFFERLAALVSDPERRAALASNARRTNLDRWDAPVMAERTLEIYRELLTGAALTETAA